MRESGDLRGDNDQHCEVAWWVKKTRTLNGQPATATWRSLGTLTKVGFTGCGSGNLSTSLFIHWFAQNYSLNSCFVPIPEDLRSVRKTLPFSYWSLFCNDGLWLDPETNFKQTLIICVCVCAYTHTLTHTCLKDWRKPERCRLRKFTDKAKGLTLEQALPLSWDLLNAVYFVSWSTWRL